jgi:DNA polymerase I-like protein with 3'-5' exonuclease and polymerase domains
MRAAGNHIIQGTGAQLTKKLQRRIWDIQPSGIYQWRVMPLNIHDEIMAPTALEYKAVVKKIVDDFVAEFKSKIPLIEIEWSDNLKTWADK